MAGMSDGRDVIWCGMYIVRLLSTRGIVLRSLSSRRIESRVRLSTTCDCDGGSLNEARSGASCGASGSGADGIRNATVADAGSRAGALGSRGAGAGLLTALSRACARALIDGASSCGDRLRIEEDTCRRSDTRRW